MSGITRSGSKRVRGLAIAMASMAFGIAPVLIGQCNWTPGTVTIFTPASNCSVGIGATAPIYLLHVKGLGGSNKIAIEDTQASGHVFSLNNGGSGIGGAGKFTIDDSTSSKNLMFFNGITGDAGIGTIVPGARLDVTSVSSALLSGFMITNADTTNTVDNGTGMLFRVGTALSAGITARLNGSSANSDMYFRVNQAGTLYEAMRIKSTGSIGIGTASPNVFNGGGGITVLTIQGNPTAVNRYGVLELSHTYADATGNVIGGLYFTDPNATASKLSAAVQAITDGATANNRGSDLTFSTKTDGGGLAERMRIDGNGNVGIGTAALSPGLTMGSGKPVRVQIDPGNDTTGGAVNYQLLSRQTGGGMRTWALFTAAVGASVGPPANSFSIWDYPAGAAPPVCCNQRFTILPTPVAGPAPAIVTIDGAGNLIVGGNIAAKYQDLAEWVPTGKRLAPGTVVVVSPDRIGEVAPSHSRYDTSVAGVVSSAPGVLLGEGGDEKSMIATTGRVRVHASAAPGAIHVGDLLVSSDLEGIAMRSEPIEIAGTKLHRPGTVIGKALEPLASGESDILVLLSLQ